MISLPLQPKVIEKKENRAVFEIEALYPGYGVTIGNALRRVLLSSLQGAAVTEVKIKNVQHEFSTLPGVMEDVIQLMINLKQLRFKLHDNEPQTGFLKVKGEKEVKASDFELSSQVDLINKNAHIASLTSKSAELDMEIKIEKGVGYKSRDSHKKSKEKIEIGTILLDAIFTPVRKVSCKVENMRVGERTDFDRLFLELETDGTINPETAFCQACEILVSHFDLICQEFKPKELKTTEDEVVKKKAKKEKSKTKSKKTAVKKEKSKNKK